MSSRKRVVREQMREQERSTALTRHHTHLKQKEERKQHIAMYSVAAAMLVAILVLGFGYWREVLGKGAEAAGVARGDVITNELLAKYAAYQQAQLDRQVADLTAIMSKPDADQTQRQTAQVVLQVIQQRSANLPEQSLQDLIDAKLIKDGAAQRAIAATPADLDLELRREMTQDLMSSFTQSTATTVAEPKINADEARLQLRALLAKGRLLSEDEVTRYVLEPRFLRDQLQNVLGKDIPTTGEQVRARHILVDTEDKAKEVKQRLGKGESFESLAKELSTDTGSKDQGGELGWFGKGQMIPEFEQAAFALAPGQISEPIKTTYGFHVIQVEEKDPNRPLEASVISQKRAQAFSDWLAGERAADTQAVKETLTPDGINWVNKYIERELGKTANQ